MSEPWSLTPQSSRIKQARQARHSYVPAQVRAVPGRGAAGGPGGPAHRAGDRGVRRTRTPRTGTATCATWPGRRARPGCQVDDDALDAVSETVTSQGVVAVCRLVDVPLDEAVRRDARLVAVGVQVRDPGNAGTLIRAADAAGADAVVLSTESVDPHNPKAVRASVGSVFHLPISLEAEIVAAVAWLAEDQGLQVLAADGTATPTWTTCIDDGRSGHTHGLAVRQRGARPPGQRHDAGRPVVRVPIYGRAESLNLATAAAVCLYASARAQRRTADS